MTKALLLFLTTFIFCNIAQCSNQTSDIEFRVLDSLCNNTANKDSCIRYLNLLENKAIQDSSAENLYRAYFVKVKRYREFGVTDSAKKYAKLNLEYSSKNKNIQNIIQTINQLGMIYGEQGQSNKSLELYFDGLNLVERYPNNPKITEYLYFLYNNIAVTYGQQSRFEESKVFLLKTLNVLEKDKSHFAVLNNLGCVETYLGNYDEAEKYLVDAYGVLDTIDTRSYLDITSSFTDLYIANNNYSAAMKYGYLNFNLAFRNNYESDLEYIVPLIDSLIPGYTIVANSKLEVESPLEVKDESIILEDEEVKEDTDYYWRNIIDFVLLLIIISLLLFKRKPLKG
jgi:tetratricopeptide (TPR) repeat protein